LSPVKKTLMDKKTSNMLIKRSATAAYPAYDSATFGDEADGSKGKEVIQYQEALYCGDACRAGAENYLPLPRTKDNPNARGGAINIHAQAPNARLDVAMNFD